MTKEEAYRYIENLKWLKGYDNTTIGGKTVGEILDEIKAMLKEQKQIKSPDEFKSLLLGMFDSIWDVEIDHPVFQDTVGELMEGVLQAYRQAVKWDD